MCLMTTYYESFSKCPSIYNVCKKINGVFSHMKKKTRFGNFDYLKTCISAVIYFLPHTLSARNKLDVFLN